jgi:hypothetical protein
LQRLRIVIANHAYTISSFGLANKKAHFWTKIDSTEPKFVPHGSQSV